MMWGIKWAFLLLTCLLCFANDSTILINYKQKQRKIVAQINKEGKTAVKSTTQAHFLSKSTPQPDEDKIVLIMLLPMGTKYYKSEKPVNNIKHEDHCVNSLSEAMNIPEEIASDLLHEYKMDFHAARVGTNALLKISEAFGDGVLKYIGEVRPGLNCVSRKNGKNITEPSTIKPNSQTTTEYPTNVIVFTAEKTSSKPTKILPIEKGTRHRKIYRIEKPKKTLKKYVTHVSLIS